LILNYFHSALCEREDNKLRNANPNAKQAAIAQKFWPVKKEDVIC
jgi:hypothetical protein